MYQVQSHPKMNIWSLVILLVLLHTLNGFSQDLSITFSRIPEDQSLSLIGGMDQDDHGYIWMATGSNGLIRYDGIDMKSFYPGGSVMGATTLRFECIHIDKNGIIWLGDFTYGLYAFDPITEIFTSYTHNKSDPGSLHNNEIRAILEDSRGTLWIGTRMGIDTLDRKTGKFHHIKGETESSKHLSQAHVRAIYEDSEGTIWIGSGSPFAGDDLIPGVDGLYKLNRSTGQITRYTTDNSNLADNRIRAIYEDSRGEFWIGTAGKDGLYTMNRKSGTFQQHHYDPEQPEKLSRPPLAATDDIVMFINEDGEGYIWIGTLAAGMNRYDPTTKTVEHFGPREEGIHKIDRDDHWASLRTDDGLLWVSNNWRSNDIEKRLLRISANPPRLNFHDRGKGVASFYQDEDGVIWMGTGYGLDRLNKDGTIENFLVNKNASGNNENVVPYVEKGPSDHLLLSTFNGLYTFNMSTEKFDEIPFGHDNISVRLTHYNEDGTFWIGSLIGLDLYDMNTGKVIHYHNAAGDSSKIVDGEIKSIEIDEKGFVWVAGYRGLFRFDPDTETFDAMLEGMFYESRVFIDNDGEVWLSADRSFFQYNPENNSLEKNDDLASYLNFASPSLMMEYGQGTFWIKCANGYILYNKNTKSTNYLGASWFDHNLIDRMIISTLSGQILIGSMNGYYEFHPDDIKFKSVKSKPFISKYFIDNEIHVRERSDIQNAETGKVVLSFDQKNLAFEFDVVDFLSKGAEKRLLFKLEGFDPDWRQKEGEVRAFYYNLNPGNYTFRVKSTNLYGEWGEDSMVIKINPPWYQTIWAYCLYGLVFIGGVYSTHVIQKGRVVRKEREHMRQKELSHAREIEKAYEELKITQSQLIQSEKMASLGELTAGIAHEIQNPLNFVNNFSEVSNELLDEMHEELSKGDVEEAKAIANNVKQNLGKIIFHGKRADGIVKGMLQHSRVGHGEKEPTDINALADEYLRLAYHGLRAKDKSFNADFKAELDPELPKIMAVPQDIGRVLLNLINNAFYVVNEKSKEGIADYKPRVEVTTQKIEKEIKIIVKDNGPGIPKQVRDKIFHPFFTTKPTGQGTGLGLSLSYDIVKAHGGTIEVSTNTTGTQFSITLPINQ
jgi:signal transduction histidine kinase/ligand-binding sensor domain-containing protein